MYMNPCSSLLLTSEFGAIISFLMTAEVQVSCSKIRGDLTAGDARQCAEESQDHTSREIQSKIENSSRRHRSNTEIYGDILGTEVVPLRRNVAGDQIADNR